MNTMNKLKSYRQSDVASADGTQLVILAYDGAIGFLRRAQHATLENRSGEAASHVLRAQKIVVHLLTSLDPSAGEIAANLTRLYTFVLDRLAAAASKPDVDAIESALAILEELRDAWAQIASQEHEPREQEARAPRGGDLSVCA